MKFRRAFFVGRGRVTLAALLMFASHSAAPGLQADSESGATDPSLDGNLHPAVRPSSDPAVGRSVSTLPRIRLFEPLDSQPGSTTLVIRSGALSDVGHHAGRFVVEDFPLQSRERVALELRRFHVAGAATRFVIGHRGGPDTPLDFDPSSIVLLSGIVVDHPESHVFLALSAPFTAGRIELGPGRPTYRLSSRLGRDRATVPGQVAVFRASTPGAGPDVPLCGLEPMLPPGLLNDVGPSQPADSTQRTGGGPIKGLRTIELAIETDYDYFVLFGDTTAAASYVTALIGAASDIFTRDTNHRFQLTFVRIWDDPNDLYNDPDGFAAFNAFVDHWENNMGSVQRDAAQYLTGRRDLPFGGIAYLNAVCSFGYSMCGYLLGFFPDPDFPSVYHYDLEVSAHELGHNCGSLHTDAYNPPIDRCFPVPNPPQRGTIMSYCSQSVSGGNAVHEMRFHARVQTQLRNFLTSLGCVIDDCNGNNIADAADIAFAISSDVNGNGIPDECEDCDSNGVLDPDDIAGGAPDLNGNTIPDRCEPDCNGNNVPDDLDILLNTSTDAYGNNIPDECEADCNSNGTSDFTELQAVLPLDINRNTILDSCEDCDGDGITDAQALAGAHNCWIASDVLDLIGEYHADTGVLVKNAAAGYLADPQDVAITRSGRILVSSALDDRIVEFDRSGAYIGDLVGAGGGGLDYPTGLLITPGQTLLVSSRNTHRVIEYALDTGAYLGDFVAAASGGLNAPFGLAFGLNGNLFVAGFDNQVRQYDGQTGVFVGIFVTAGDNGGLSNPRGMTFKPDGNLLVAGFSSNAVLEYEGATGAFLRVFHYGGTVYGPWGVRVGPNGNVFLTRDYVPVRGAAGGPEPLHTTTTRIYEYDPVRGYHLRSYVLGDDTGLSSPTGFAFMPGSATDCNANYIPDACDIAAGTSLDLDGDGTPDECGACCQVAGCQQLNRTTCQALAFGTYLGDQTRCLPACAACDTGDWDCDGDVDLGDHLLFFDCLNGPDTAPAPSLTSTQACLDAFDFDFDGDVDLGDYDPFVVAWGQL